MLIPRTTLFDSDEFFQWREEQSVRDAKNNLETFLNAARYTNALKRKLFNRMNMIRRKLS